MTVVRISQSSEGQNPLEHNQRIGTVLLVHVCKRKDYAWDSQCPLRTPVLTTQDQ